MIEVRFEVPLDEIEINHQTVAARKAHEAYILSLLRQGDISAGRAAELLGINRWDLDQLMSVYGISPFDETITEEELRAEAQRMTLPAQSR